MAENHAFTDLINRRGFWCPVHNVKILPTGCDVQCSRPVVERGAPTCGYSCTARLAQGLTPPKGGEESPAQRQDEPATQEQGAWPLIRERAGGASQSGLAKRIKCTQGGVQSFLNQLRKGRAPSGAVAAAVLKLTGLDMSELLVAEGHALPAEAQQPQPTQLAQSLGAVLGVDPAQAESETEPESSSAAPAASSPPAGAAESFSPAAPATSAAPSGPAATSPAGPEGQARAAIEAVELGDFVPYTPKPGRQQGQGTAMISLAKDGDLNISTAAVHAFGLERATHVRLFWSSRSGCIGILPLFGPDPDALALGRKKACDMRQVAAGGFLKRFGLRPVCKRYPITPGPGGLLVAKIEDAA